MENNFAKSIVYYCCTKSNIKTGQIYECHKMFNLILLVKEVYLKTFPNSVFPDSQYIKKIIFDIYCGSDKFEQNVKLSKNMKAIIDAVYEIGGSYKNTYMISNMTKLYKNHCGENSE